MGKTWDKPTTAIIQKKGWICKNNPTKFQNLSFLSKNASFFRMRCEKKSGALQSADGFSGQKDALTGPARAGFPEKDGRKGRGRQD